MPTHSIEIRKPDDRAVTAVGLSVPTGFSIDSVEIRSADRAAAFLRRFDRWSAVVLESEVRRYGDPLSLRVETGSSASPIVELIYEARDRPHVGRPAATGGSTISTSGAIALEESSIHHAPDADLLRSSRYFHALDSATSPALLPSRAWPGVPSYTTRLTELIRDASTSLYGVFRTRIERREMQRDLPRPVVLMLGAIQIDILRRHLASWDPSANVEIAHWAYASFGAGDLLLEIRERGTSLHENLANGGPNGVFIFLFAEFALQAIKYEIDREAWRILLPGMAAACELFLLCYGPIDSSGRIERRDAAYYTNQRPARRIRTEDRLRVLHRYCPMSIEEIDRRLTELARGALLIQDARVTPIPHLHVPPAHAAIGFDASKAVFPELPWISPKASGIEFADPT